MAADVQQGCQEQHWTAKGGVMGAVLLTSFAPFVGLAVVVPCLLAARRAGVNTTPYVIALAVALLWLLLLVGSFLAQSQIEPR
jgi:hypothetical protein